MVEKHWRRRDEGRDYDDTYLDPMARWNRFEKQHLVTSLTCLWMVWRRAMAATALSVDMAAFAVAAEDDMTMWRKGCDCARKKNVKRRRRKVRTSGGGAPCCYTIIIIYIPRRKKYMNVDRQKRERKRKLRHL